MLRHVHWLVFVILLVVAPAALAADPDPIDVLIRGGALDLALKRLDEEQAQAQAQEWVLFERRRIELYVARGQWDALAQRVDGEPPDLPAEFRHWALKQAAEARLAANDFSGARRYLRQLLWQEQPDADTVAHARRLVIRSYLLEDNLADAQAGVLRYQQDYNARSDAWQVLHAEILLRAEDYKGAFEVLTGVETAEARLLRQLAGLRVKFYKPQDVLKESARLAAGFKTNRENQRRALVIQAEAALAAADNDKRVVAFEQVLSLPSTASEKFFHAKADDLWQSYERLAESVGNDAKLLVGNDSAWLGKAKTFTAKEPHRARALYAFLVHHAEDENARATANRLLAESLLKDGHGETLRALYLNSTRIAGPDAVPQSVRYRLAEIALAQHDMKLAAALLKDLTEPPAGEDATIWTLRRARALVYIGDIANAQPLLMGLLEQQKAVDAEFARYFLQVVFDLQTLGRHSEALALLEKLSARAETKSLQRELLYWRADSHAALGQNADAGELYLRSAVFNSGNGDDPWGQTARFHAAGALARAGMTVDARHIYTALLKSTPDPARRAQIERQLQQLWLNGPTTP